MLSIIIILIVIAIDQLSKIACANALKLGESVEIIKGVFSIAYVENRGAAFGMLQNAQVFFIIANRLRSNAVFHDKGIQAYAYGHADIACAYIRGRAG